MNQDNAAVEEMACQELVEVITDYLEEALRTDDARRLEAHLDECPDCRTYIDQMRQTIRLAGRLFAERLEPQTQTLLVAAFRSWRAQPPPDAGGSQGQSATAG